MSEISWPWSCAAVGDGGPYSVEIVEITNAISMNRYPKEAGVVYWTDDTPFPGQLFKSSLLLIPKHPGGNIITIASGVALVKGWVYINAHNPVTGTGYDVSGGNANAIDIIGLRLDVDGQQVRTFHGRGGVGAKYNLVQTSAIWEIPLAEVTLDGSGDYLSIKDVRDFVIGTPTQIGSFAVNTDWGFNLTTGVDTYKTADQNPPQLAGRSGIQLPNAASALAMGVFVMPMDTLDDTFDFSFELQPYTEAGNKFSYIQLEYNIYSGGSPLINGGSGAFTFAVPLFPSNTRTISFFGKTATYPLAIGGATVEIFITRFGAHANDTYTGSLGIQTGIVTYRKSGNKGIYLP